MVMHQLSLTCASDEINKYSSIIHKCKTKHVQSTDICQLKQTFTKSTTVHKALHKRPTNVVTGEHWVYYSPQLIWLSISVSRQCATTATTTSRCSDRKL